MSTQATSHTTLLWLNKENYFYFKSEKVLLKQENKVYFTKRRIVKQITFMKIN